MTIEAKWAEQDGIWCAEIANCRLTVQWHPEDPTDDFDYGRRWEWRTDLGRAAGRNGMEYGDHNDHEARGKAQREAVAAALDLAQRAGLTDAWSALQHARQECEASAAKTLRLEDASRTLLEAMASRNIAAEEYGGVGDTSSARGEYFVSRLARADEAVAAAAETLKKTLEETGA